MLMMEVRMDLVRNMRCLVLAASGILLPTAPVAEEHDGRWVSHPRALIVIVIGDDGGRIFGPEWEYVFSARANEVDFEIAPGRRLVLRRDGANWVGEYFHPRTRPGEHQREPHTMLFVRETAAAR
jgi:hypothetical protein